LQPNVGGTGGMQEAAAEKTGSGTESGTGGMGQASRWTLTRVCQPDAKTQETIHTQPATGRVVTRIWVQHGY